MYIFVMHIYLYCYDLYLMHHLSCTLLIIVLKLIGK
jgi:hypothetical protein